MITLPSIAAPHVALFVSAAAIGAVPLTQVGSPRTIALYAANCAVVPNSQFAGLTTTGVKPLAVA